MFPTWPTDIASDFRRPPMARVTVLHVDCHGCEWTVLNQLYLQVGRAEQT